MYRATVVWSTVSIGQYQPTDGSKGEIETGAGLFCSNPYADGVALS